MNASDADQPAFRADNLPCSFRTSRRCFTPATYLEVSDSAYPLLLCADHLQDAADGWQVEYVTEITAVSLSAVFPVFAHDDGRISGDMQYWIDRCAR